MTSAQDLPVDVLGEIFQICTREEQLVRSSKATKCETCKPLSMGRFLLQVCRNWRLAALSTPFMWRYIHIDLKPRYPFWAPQTNTPRLMPRMNQWAIERSGVCSLELSFSNVGSEDALELMKSLLCSGSTVGRRVERLEIGLAGAAFLHYLSFLEMANTVNLRELVLYHTGYFTVHETIPSDALVITANSPQLQTLILGRIQWMTPMQGLFDLSGIKTLTLDLGHKHEALLLRTLTCFPNLTDLNLQCTDHVRLTEAWEPIPEATLPSLQSITVDPFVCTYSLHTLHAPELKTITAKGFARVSPRFLESLPRPAKYATLRLEHFNPDLERTLVWSTGGRSYKSLDCMKAEWTSKFASGVAGFIVCMQAHREINKLELVSCAIGDEYLSPLAENTTLLPNLDSLRIHDCPKVSRTLVDHIASYRRSVSSRFTAEYTIQ